MKVLLCIAAGSFLAIDALASPVQIDPVDVRWTFGAHEPYSMYRRIGRRTTGGVDGNARWIGQWLDWWDEHAPEKMEELGLNFLHSRFYKGMGWEVEKKDFPNVQKFVRNCHAHGVKALAYVQFATVYQEMMKKEVPDIDTWASVGLGGEKNTYSVAIPGSYYRWLPCVNCREWEDYLKRMCTIALTDGGFDGIMFDNVFGMPCYCSRCERLFKEHLASIKNPSERFGMDDLSDVAIPRVDAKWLHGSEIRDPVLQAWQTWRSSCMDGVMGRLYAHIKSVKPDAIVSGNPSSYRARNMHVTRGQDMASLCRHFDLIIMQNGNSPKVLPNGRIVNRVRDLKFAQDIGQRIVALSDTDACERFPTPEGFLLPMVEDLVFGGIPTDRTVISPAREKGFISTAKFAFRKPLHDRFNAFAKSRRTELSAPTLRRVWLFYPTRSVYLSDGAHQGIAAAEEVLLRNHVPYGYLVSRPGETPKMPPAEDILLVPDMIMLADEEIDALVARAKSGGRLVVTGVSGRFDGWNAERFEDELQNRLKGLGGHVVVTARSDALERASFSWTYSVPPPKDGGRALMVDLASVGYNAPVEFRGLPPHVFAEYRTLADGRFAVHLVNYALDKKVEGVSVDIHGASCEFSEPLREGDKPVAVAADGKLPSFGMYAMLVVDKAGRGRADSVDETETSRWQAVIDAVAQRGGGVVSIPAGRHLVGQLDLKSNVELHLEKGAVLEGAVGMQHYRITELPYSEGTWSSVVSAMNVTNVAVTGEGEIFGNGGAWPQPLSYGGNQEGTRPRGLVFGNVRGLRLRDFRLRDAACWGIVCKCCEDVDIRRVKVDSHANANNDGMDIEARNVVIADCDIDSGDDGVCLKSNNPDFVVENVLVTNVISRSHCNALKIGTATHGTVRNILFVDCRTDAPRREFIDRRPGKNNRRWYENDKIAAMSPGSRASEPSGWSAIAVMNVDGGIVEDVTYRNIVANGSKTPIFVRGGRRTKRACGTPPSDKWIFRNVLIENVTGTALSSVPSSVTGVDGCRVVNCTLRNVHLKCRGLGTEQSEKWLAKPVPENPGGYPEAHVFHHALTAWGLYARHVDGLKLENCEFELLEGTADSRKKIVLDDVK